MSEQVSVPTAGEYFVQDGVVREVTESTMIDCIEDTDSYTIYMNCDYGDDDLE